MTLSATPDSPSDRTLPPADGKEGDAAGVPFTPEIVVVKRWKIACDGDVAGGLGHPRVWLRIPPEVGFVECGYCDRRYVIDPENAEGDH